MRLNRTQIVGLVIILFAVGLYAFYSLRRNTPAARVAETGTMTNGSTNATPDTPKVSFRARYAIRSHAILTPDMFEMVRLKSDESADTYVTDLRTQGVGFITAKQIAPRAKLRQDDLLGHISVVGVSAAIQDPSLRAFSIPVANKATLHDIVSIGDYVDVIATFNQAETRILAPGVRVLAVDVYGANYEKVPAAKRGPYRGDDRPGGTPQAADSKAGPPNPNGEAGPTPPPASGQPQPARPEASITLEMRPDQAAAIALAQASNAPLDFLIQPRPSINPTISEPIITEARVTMPQVAPYAMVSKRNGSGSAGSAPARTQAQPVQIAARLPRQPIPHYDEFPNPNGKVIGGPLTPLTGFVAPKKTYEITVYPDGQPARTNTVPLPE